MGLPCPVFGPLRLRDGSPYQRPNSRRGQIRGLCDAHVANQFALATQQVARIGQDRAEVKTEVDPISMRRGEHERVAGPVREGEVVGDSVHLVDEFAGLGSLVEDQPSRGQCELSNHFAVRCEQFEVLRIGWTQAHPASVAPNDAPLGLAWEAERCT